MGTNTGEAGLNDAVDLLFSLSGTVVRSDYEWPLWQSLCQILPWLIDEPSAGIHPLSGTSAGAGLIYLSHRAHLTLRLPQRRLADANALSGRQIDLGGGITIGESRPRALLPSPAQYSPCVILGGGDEETFLAQCGTHLDEMGVSCSLVCGRAQARNGGEEEIRGFSLMLHGLAPEHSLRIQQWGLGEARKLGCGIFVPHKTATAVGAA